MIIKYDNRSITDLLTESCTVKANISAGSSVSITVDSNNGFSEDDYIIIGKTERSRTEIALINSAVSEGTTMQVDSLANNHNPFEVITKIPYNKVRIYNAITEDGEKTLISDKTINVDQRYTEFEVEDSVTGFIFFTVYNENDSSESGYSLALPIDTEDRDNLQYVWEFVDTFLEVEMDKDSFKMLADITQDEVFSERNWSFREATAEFDTVSGQVDYDMEEDCGITDFGSLLSARTETEMLTIIDSDIDDNLQLTSLSLSPYSICVYGGDFRVYVDGEKTITLKYHKTAESLVSSGTKIGVSLVSVLGYGILEKHFLTRDTDLADRFERKKIFAIRKMQKLDEKYTSKVSSMRYSGGVAFRDVQKIIAD